MAAEAPDLVPISTPATNRVINLEEPDLGDTRIPSSTWSNSTSMATTKKSNKARSFLPPWESKSNALKLPKVQKAKAAPKPKGKKTLKDEQAGTDQTQTPKRKRKYTKSAASIAKAKQKAKEIETQWAGPTEDDEEPLVETKFKPEETLLAFGFTSSKATSTMKSEQPSGEDTEMPEEKPKKGKMKKEEKPDKPKPIKREPKPKAEPKPKKAKAAKTPSPLSFAAMKQETKKEPKAKVVHSDYTKHIRTEQAKVEQAKQQKKIKDALKIPRIAAMMEDRAVVIAFAQARQGKPQRLTDLMKNKEISRNVNTLIAVGYIPLLANIKEDGSSKPFRFMDLPKEVRKTILALVLVREKFVVPEMPTGSHQPDISMVCKELRAEVLPLFYGLNIFSVQFAGPSPVKVEIDQDNKRIGTTQVEKWATALESTDALGEGKWIEQITHWSFSYFDPSAKPRRAKRDVEKDQQAQADERDDKSFFISVRTQRNEKGHIMPYPEIHREAPCILPGAKHGKCRVLSAPAWLNDMVIQATDDGVSAQSIMLLVADVATRISEITEFRCQEIKVAPDSAEAAEVELECNRLKIAEVETEKDSGASVSQGQDCCSSETL